MIIYDYKNTPIDVVKCKRPKFRDKNGKTWDSGRIYIDDKEYEFWLDTTWGIYGYFVYDRHYHKVRMMSEPFRQKGEYNIEPFQNEKFTTTKQEKNNEQN